MKYNININQERLSIHPDVTLQDACVIDWLYGMFGSESERINDKRVNGYTCISLSHLIDDMPLLRIQTNSGASKLVKRIQRMGFIDTVYMRKERKLYAKPKKKLNDLFFSLTKSVKTMTQVLKEDSQVLKDSNQYTSINTLNNPIYEEQNNLKKESAKIEVPATVVTPVKKFTSTYITRLLGTYNKLFEKNYDFKPVIDIGRFGKTMKNLQESRSELQIRAAMIIYFQWHGMEGNNNLEYEKLTKSAFNPQWFGSNFNQYEAYARNVMGLKFDDEEELQKFINKNLK